MKKTSVPILLFVSVLIVASLACSAVSGGQVPVVNTPNLIAPVTEIVEVPPIHMAVGVDATVRDGSAFTLTETTAVFVQPLAFKPVTV